MGAVAMLQPDRKAAGDIVIDEDGAGPVDPRPVAQARPAKRIRPVIERERCATRRTERRGQEHRTVPAGVTQRARIGHEGIASEALRRQQNFERMPRRVHDRSHRHAHDSGLATELGI